jgi:hypothetical protein
MRAAINAGARVAQGKYLMKCDGHCLFDEGFDVKLAQDCRHNWTLVPRRYILNAEDWSRDDSKVYEFEYIDLPSFKGRKWPEYAERIDDRLLVNLMTFQGSCWFMRRERFWYLGGLDDINYGGMGREAQEVSLKTWLSGGRQLLSRKTWYAHWNKPKSTYPGRGVEKEKSIAYAKELWLNDKWPLQERKLSWLIEKFSPLPTHYEKPAVTEPMEYIQRKYKLSGCYEKISIKIDGMTRVDMYKLFAELGYKVGCEVGVWTGKNAVNIFENIPGVKMFLVDPYRNYAYVRKPRGENRIEKTKAGVFRKLEGRNMEFLEMLSEDAIKQAPDNFLDFVYIDAEHTYDMAMLDIILWNRKVKEGGIISGHDYYHDPKHGVGVKWAVDDYVKAHNIKPLYITDSKAEVEGKVRMPSWFWVKT